MTRMDLDELLSMNGNGPVLEDGSTVKLPCLASIVDILAAEGSYKIFGMALKETGLEERLRGAGPFTVFAPIDDAFQRLPKLAELLKDTTRLRAVLMRHLIWGDLDSKAIWGIPCLTPLDGKSLCIAKAAFRIEDAEVVQTNLKAPNGTIHGVNRVFMDEHASAQREAGTAVDASLDSSAAFINEKLKAGAAWLNDKLHPGSQMEMKPGARAGKTAIPPTAA